MHRLFLAHFVVFFACAAATLAPHRALAQATLLTGLGGTADLGENTGTAGPIDLSAAFPDGLSIFGTSYSQLYINENGYVSLGGPHYSSYDNGATITYPLIATWWATMDSDIVSAAGDNEIYWDLTPGSLVVTWYRRSSGENPDLRSVVTVQMILSAAPASAPTGSFDVEFRYVTCGWEAAFLDWNGDGYCTLEDVGHGDCRVGSGAFAGPGNRGFTFTAWDDACGETNVDAPGVFRFQVRPAGIASCGDGEIAGGEECDDGNMLGGDGCDASCAIEVAVDAGTDPDAGIDAGTTSSDAGSSDAGSSDAGSSDAGSSDADSGAEGPDAGVADAGVEIVPMDGGCGCSVPGRSSRTPLALALIAGIVVLRTRRRARSS